MKDCVASGLTPLLAVIVSGYDPPVVAAGVPLNVAVPFPLFVNVTPAGSAPNSVIVATVGVPLVVTVNVPALPTVNVVAPPLVITGAGDCPVENISVLARTSWLRPPATHTRPPGSRVAVW